MVVIEICVGSSCHLKGAPELVELMQKQIAEGGYEDDVALMGNFCIGKCNRVGVTVTVNDVVHTGITPGSFHEFWTGTVLPAIQKDREG